MFNIIRLILSCNQNQLHDWWCWRKAKLWVLVQELLRASGWPQQGIQQSRVLPSVAPSDCTGPTSTEPALTETAGESH